MAIINQSAYKRADSDTRLLQSAGDMIFSSDLSAPLLGPTVTWGSGTGIIYFYNGIRYVSDTFTSKNITTDYAYATGNVYVYADENGIELYDAVQPTKLLVSTLGWNLGLSQIQTRADEQTGPLVDRTGQINHLLLTNLQGGTTGEYYHLTQDQYNTLTNIAIQAGTIVDYSTTGKVVTLVRPTLGTDYAIGFSVNGNNTFSEDFTYSPVITAKSTTSFTVFWVKEYNNAGIYTKTEFSNGTFTTGGSGETTIDSIDYSIIEDNTAAAGIVNTRSMTIESVTAGSFVGATSGSTDEVSYVTLINGSQTDVRFQIPIPQDYIIGSDIELVLTYAPSGADVNSVDFDIKVDLYRVGVDVLGTVGDTITTPGSITMPGVAGEINEIVSTIVDTSGNVNATAVARGDILNINIFRDGGADTSASDFHILNLELRY